MLFALGLFAIGLGAAITHVFSRFVSNGIGFLLSRLFGIRDLKCLAVFALRVSLSAFVFFFLHAALLALHDVGQLVGQKLGAFFGAWIELTRVKMHVAANCKRARVELVGGAR